MKATPVIDPRTSLLLATQGSAFSWTPAATGSPTLWSAIGLPSGLSINSSTGVISGTPTNAGVYGFTLQATNYSSVVFTADAGTDLLTAAGHPFEELDELEVETDGTLPAPLVASTAYYGKTVTEAESLKLSATPGGAAINITTTGTGVHTVKRPQTGELSVVIAVEQSTSRLSADDLTIELDFDIVTRKVTMLGLGDYVSNLPLETPPPTLLTPPVLTLKPGERFPVLIGFTREATLQELNMNSIEIVTREEFGSQKIQLNEGGFIKVGSGDSTRYRGIISVNQSKIDAILSSFDEVIGAKVDITGEIVVETSAATPADITGSASTTLSVMGNKSDANKYSGTLAIVGIEAFEGTMDVSLDVTLDVADRPSQDCAASLSFSLSWDSDSGVFSVASVSGTATDSGTTDGDNWVISQFAVGTITGTSNGISIPFTISTSADANAPYPKITIPPNNGISSTDGIEVQVSVPGDLMLYNGETLLETIVLSDATDFATFEAAVISAWETMMGSPPQSVSLTLGVAPECTLEIELPNDSPVTKVYWAGSGTDFYVESANFSGVSKIGTVEASVEQLSAWPVSYHKRRSDTMTFRFLDSIG